MATYVWRPNLACVATYTIITSPKFMRQTSVEFKKAEAVKMKQLQYWPKSGMSTSMLKGLAWGMGQRFLSHLAGTYTNEKQHPLTDSADIILEVANVFENPEANMTELARVVDSHFKFSDE